MPAFGSRGRSIRRPPTPSRTSRGTFRPPAVANPTSATGPRRGLLAANGPPDCGEGRPDRASGPRQPAFGAVIAYGLVSRAAAPTAPNASKKAKGKQTHVEIH